jgi:hypothetical protein
MKNFNIIIEIFEWVMIHKYATGKDIFFDYSSYCNVITVWIPKTEDGKWQPDCEIIYLHNSCQISIDDTDALKEVINMIKAL